jgi:lysophospholipase L1-like esterase
MIIGLFFLFLFMEVGIRFVEYRFGVNPGEKAPTTGPAFNIPINMKDPQLLWRLRPFARFKGMRINSKGFRGPEFSEEKKHDIYRIINMGNSCTFGVGVPYKETYSGWLESILTSQATPLKKYEVINAGIPGYSSLQGLRYLKNEIIKYKPDIITVLYGLNDYLFTNAKEDKDIPHTSPWIIYLDDLMTKSHLYSFFKKRLTLLIAPKTKYPPYRRVKLYDFKKNLKEIVRIAKKTGAKVLFLNISLRPEVPLVVNAIPIPIDDGKGGQFVKWLRPSFIGNNNYFVKTEFEGSISVLEEAVKKYPQWAMAHFLLAKRFEKVGQIEKAKVEFDKARKMDIDRDVISKYNMVIEEVTREEQVPIVNLVSTFEMRKGEDLFLDERHFNGPANRMIAEEIYNALKKNNLIVLD